MAPHNSHFHAPVKGAPPPGASTNQTRTQIMLAASNLFDSQGYHGTTTREIADTVGIRQPSLFHHFESKAAIMEALLDEDLGSTVSDRERLARSDEPAGVRLYRYVLREVRHIVSSPYNVAGIYSEEVRTSAELAPWYARRRRLHRAIDRIVRDGKQSGEFIDAPTDLVRAQILGTLERALTGYSAGKAAFDPRRADHLATLLVRSVLADTAEVAQIRQTVLSSESFNRTHRHGSGSAPSTEPAPLVSDRAWHVIRAAIPTRGRAPGGRWKNDRLVLEAIAYRHINAASWRNLPRRLGPWQTAWRRHLQWREDGTWERMKLLASKHPQLREELAWLAAS